MARVLRKSESYEEFFKGVGETIQDLRDLRKKVKGLQWTLLIGQNIF